MDTEHRVHDEYTSIAVTRMLCGIGCKVLSSSQLSQNQSAGLSAVNSEQHGLITG